MLLYQIFLHQVYSTTAMEFDVESASTAWKTKPLANMPGCLCIAGISCELPTYLSVCVFGFLRFQLQEENSQGKNL